MLQATRCLLSYLWQKLSPTPSTDHEASFESWVTHRFGRRLFLIFFQSYSEKLWGIPCTELSADFAAQRIRQFSLWEALRSAISPSRSRQHKTLVDRFAYPIGGTGAVYDTIADQITSLGGSIHTNCPVHKITRNDSTITGVQLASGEQKRFDHVVSTMPLTMLMQGMDDASKKIPAEVSESANQLCFRNTLLVYLHVDHDNVFDDQWLYIQSPEIAAGRVTNFKNWTSDLHGGSSTSILAVERWCNDDDSEWSDDEASLVQRSVKELRQIGILSDETILDGHVMRIRRSYPVYKRGYQENVGRIADYLSGLSGITPIGRYGAFKYNNQDHSILMGLLAADNILNAAGHNLWDINADFDRYQEQSLITESGIVPIAEA